MGNLSDLSKELQDAWNQMSAAESADYLISPHVSKDLLNRSTSEPGTAMWIVNRSDVYDLTLQKLFDHPLHEIASRARDKYNNRHGSLNFLSPPEETGPLEEVHDHDVEEILGHPLAPFEAMMYFSKALNEDHRATSALSLTRRLLEHPPNWALNLSLKNALTENFFKMLLEDTSVFARSYAARVPLFFEDHILEALKKESSDFILGRLLQNPAASTQALDLYLNKFSANVTQFPFSFAVCLLDERLARDNILAFAKTDLPNLHRKILNFQLELPRNSLPKT